MSKPKKTVLGISFLFGGYIISKLYTQHKKLKITITQLNVYPVKSCKGTKLTKSEINQYGLKHDREFMIIDATKHRKITQRDYPKVALIDPKLNFDSNTNQLQSLTFNAPNMEPITIKLSNIDNTQIIKNIDIWGNNVNGIDQGIDIQNWLTKYINCGNICKLIRVPLNHDRIVEKEYTPKHISERLTGYSDGYPYLFICEQSLNDLNKKLKNKIKMNRFRPNIVVKCSNNEPWIMDKIYLLKNNEFTFYLTKPCARCTVPLINQENGVRDEYKNQEPRTSLLKYRSGKLLGFGYEKWNDEYFVGVNGMCDKDCGVLRIGDVFDVEYRKNLQTWKFDE